MAIKGWMVERKRKGELEWSTHFGPATEQGAVRVYERARYDLNKEVTLMTGEVRLVTPSGQVAGRSWRIKRV